MLERVEGEVRSPRPGVERPFLLLFIILNLCIRIDGRRDAVAGAADVGVGEVHHCRVASPDALDNGEPLVE